MDAEVNVLEQQKKALSKGGQQAKEVVRQLASWQAGMPQAEQALVHRPKGVMSFPVMKARAASTVNGFDRGSAKKKVKDDGLQAELQRTQMKNPIQVCIKGSNLVQYRKGSNLFSNLHLAVDQYVHESCGSQFTCV